MITAREKEAKETEKKLGFPSWYTYLCGYNLAIPSLIHHPIDRLTIVTFCVHFFPSFSSFSFDKAKYSIPTFISNLEWTSFVLLFKIIAVM